MCAKVMLLVCGLWCPLLATAHEFDGRWHGIVDVPQDEEDLDLHVRIVHGEQVVGKACTSGYDSADQCHPLTGTITGDTITFSYTIYDKDQPIDATLTLCGTILVGTFTQRDAGELSYPARFSQLSRDISE